jgi:hypothetical protein
MCLKSRLPAHIQYVLDFLTIISFEQIMFVKEFPEILLSLVDFLDELVPEPGKDQVHASSYSYLELFEMEYYAASTLQSNSFSSIDREKIPRDYILAIVLILRNCCSIPDNQRYLCSAEVKLIPILIRLLSLAVPKEMQDILDPETEFQPTHTYYQLLEHRKNVIVILATLGPYIKLPDVKTSSLLMNICCDFIGEESGSYTYQALDALVRLWLIVENVSLFEQLPEIQVKLLEALVHNLPYTGLTFQASSSVLAELELTLVLATQIISSAPPSLVQEFLKISNISRIFFNLHRRPPIPFKGSATPNQFEAFFAQFRPMRERSLKILLVLVEEMDAASCMFWKKELMLTGLKAQQDGEFWIFSLLFDFLGRE